MYHHHLWKENLDMMSDETLLIYSEYVLCHTLLTFPSLSLSSLYLILKFFLNNFIFNIIILCTLRLIISDLNMWEYETSYLFLI